MKIPQLRKKPELKSCHNVTWEDNYSWIHQSNILEVLRDSSKLLPEVREYLEKENEYFENEMKDTITRLQNYQGSLVHVTSVNKFWNEATVYFVSPVGKQQVGCFKVGLPRLKKLEKNCFLKKSEQIKFLDKY